MISDEEELSLKQQEGLHIQIDAHTEDQDEHSL